MENKIKYAAFIPVRGGSKSIPLKNIQPINGRPLVYWTIDAAIQCGKIDAVYICTDSDAIKDCVMQYKQTTANTEKLYCIDRPLETATDTASTESVMLYFAEKFEFEQMILIQATSPLLTKEHLEEAICHYESEKSDSLLSVVRQKRFIWEETEEGAKPVNYDFLNRPRRQEFSGYLVENGAFYITSKENLLQSGCRISGKIHTYEMPEETYFEIDEPSDWLIIEQLMKKREEQKSKTKKKKIQLFATDCDGVLTDGGMYYSEQGDELKKFSTQDGLGIRLLRESGVKIAIITGEDTKIVERRAQKLKIDYVYQGIRDKLPVLQKLADELGISMEEVAYMGDDVNDVECIHNAALGFSVPNAREEAKKAADVVVSQKGGDGAVREAVEYILNYNS